MPNALELLAAALAVYLVFTKHPWVPAIFFGAAVIGLGVAAIFAAIRSAQKSQEGETDGSHSRTT